MPAKILIAEDNPDSLEMLCILLGLEGYIVVTAEDGLKALTAAHTENPDLIITDIDMPQLDGIELIKRLRAQAEFSLTPILVLTGDTGKAINRARRAGADAALRKPLRVKMLFQKIKELLS